MKAQFLDVLIGDTLVGRLSKIGEVVQFLGEESYLEDPNRPTFSLAYNGLDALTGEAITRTQFTQPGTQWTRAIGRLPTFFENLLPEGPMLAWMACQRQVSSGNQFDLLAASGTNLPGAVTIRPSDSETAQQRLVAHAVAGSPADGIEGVANPMDGLFSLAGQQPKLAVSIVQRGRRYRLRNQQTNGQEIVAKLPAFGRTDVVELEFAGMTLARLAGVEVPDFWLDDVNALAVEHIDRLCPAGRFLAVERFDHPAGKPAIHMEDWCQVHGRRPKEKYTGEQSYARALLAIHTYSEDRFADAAQFFRRQVANVLMGNTDAHLKNFSFIYPGGRFPRLAPAYDMVPIIAYLGTGQYLLNEKIEAQYQALTVEDFKRVGKAARFAEKAVGKMVRDTVEQIQALWPAALQDLPIDQRLRGMILDRLDSLPLVRSLLKPGSGYQSQRPPS